MNELWMKIMDR